MALDPQDPHVQQMVTQIQQYENGIEGLKAHLRSEGIDVDGMRPMPRPSHNPLLQDTSILPPPNPHVAPRPVTRWEQPAPEPEPLPQFENERIPIENWTEIYFRPGLAQAMLYVLLPVIEQAIQARTPEEASVAIDQMDTWWKLTMPQRVALQDLFKWLETEISAQDSVIPGVLLANMRRASEAYNSGN